MQHNILGLTLPSTLKITHQATCTSANSAINQALESVERGGTILFFAPTDPGVTIPISINDLFFRNDITFTTTYAGSPADYAVALELIRARRVNAGEMITHRLGLGETGLGFQLVADAQTTHLEVRTEVQEEKQTRLQDQVLALLTSGTTLTRAKLRDTLSVKNERLGDALESLEQAGRIRRTPAGWQRID